MHIPMKAGFRFSHEPCSQIAAENILLGRSNQVNRLAKRICRSNGGSMLILGYRGVGKTSLVNEVFHAARHHIENNADLLQKKLLGITLSIAKEVSPESLIFQIIHGMRTELTYTGLYKKLKPNIRAEFELATLRTGLQISNSIEVKTDTSVSIDANLIDKILKLGFRRAKERTAAVEAAFLPYDLSSAERDVIRLSKLLQDPLSFNTSIAEKIRFRSPSINVQPVFVFDELDKLDSWDGADPEKSAMNILASLKTLFTTSGVTFIFVAGRSLLELQKKDSQRGDSIFDSVFSHVEYIPIIPNFGQALLADRAGYSSYDSLQLRSFTAYLNYMGRGIPRRTLQTFHQFIVVDGDGNVKLHFDRISLRKFRCIQELEIALKEAAVQLNEHRDGQIDAEVQDRDHLTLRYFSDWILSRGSKPFTVDDIVKAGLELNESIAPTTASAPIISDILINCLIEARFLDPVYEVNDNQTIISGNRSSSFSWYLMRHRLIELGRDLNSDGWDYEKVFFERYILTETLAEGGSSVVFEAKDIATQTTVIVKMWKYPDIALGRKLMKREFDIHLQLNTTLIPKIIEFLDEGGNLAIVMEKTPGKSLDFLLHYAHRFTWQSTVYIGRQILLLLDDIHSKNLIWGDIKPSNILVAESGKVTAIDFGTARSIEVDHTGIRMGTPQYMAPELRQGKETSLKSDFYALGVLFFQLITGDLPYQKGSDLVPLSAESVRSKLSVFDVPETLIKLVMNWLSDSPDNRITFSADVSKSLPQGSFLHNFVSEIKEITKYSQARIYNDAQKTLLVTRSIDEKTVAGQLNEHTNRISSSSMFSDTATQISREKKKLAGDKQQSESINDSDNDISLVSNISKENHETKAVFRVNDLDGTRLIEVESSELEVGRSSDNDIRINDHAYSRYHYSLTFDGVSWHVIPTNSANSVQLNGITIHGSEPLDAGAIISCGHSTLELAI